MGLLSVHEVADTLNVHEKTIRRYINNGHLDAKKIGGQWRIEETALETLMNEGTCCHTIDANHDISGDDFCVFMDTDYFSSEDKLQVCSIVDYYAEDNRVVKEISNTIMDTINDGHTNKNEMRFNYVYDKENKRARFVLWGDSIFIEKVSRKIREFEE